MRRNTSRSCVAWTLALFATSVSGWSAQTKEDACRILRANKTTLEARLKKRTEKLTALTQELNPFTVIQKEGCLILKGKAFRPGSPANCPDRLKAAQSAALTALTPLQDDVLAVKAQLTATLRDQDRRHCPKD